MDTCILIELSFVEALNNLRNGLHGTIPIKNHRVSSAVAFTGRGPRRVRYILKFPPTKNWRAMVAV